MRIDALELGVLMNGRRRGVLDEAVYRGLAALFFAAPRVLYDIHIDEDEAPTFPPRTLIFANHKRELDSVILPATLYRRQPLPRRPLDFAGREDMFVRGFLAGYDVVPGALRRLLFEIDLTRVMAALRVHPVRRFRERTMEEALREALELFGDRPISEVLVEERRPGGEGARALSELLSWAWRGRWRGPASVRAFRPELRPLLEDRARAVVRQQLEELADVLRRAVLYLAPEGVVSPDGRLQAFRSGLRRLLELVPDARLLPVCIVYDFMAPGRLRVFIRIGRSRPAPAPIPAALKAVRRDLAALHTMTASQLCSQVVWERVAEGRPEIEAGVLAQEVVALAHAVREEGLPVDGALLDDPQGCVDRWIAYVARRRIGLVQERILRFERALTAAPATHWGNPLRYCVNEMRTVRAAVREGGAAASG